MAVPLITVQGLSHTYRAGTPEAVSALRGVDLEVHAGECVALIGGNGSGKSTLAKHLNALLLPTAGEVRIDGIDTRDPEATWAVRQRVGMVFENPDDQIVAAVVEEDVAFGCENLGLPPAEIRARVDRALRVVGLESMRRHSPHLLSGGQKQRVAIAGVLAMHPQCLILDEATAMLDPQGQREVMDTVLRLCREDGLALLLITHAMDEAVLADRVVVLADGRVALEGPPAGVFSREDILGRLRIELPPIAQLSRALAKRGVTLPPGLLTVDQFVDAVVPLRRSPLTACPPLAAPPAPHVSRPASEALIRCDHLTHVYQRGSPLAATALTDVSLAIASGEAVGIIGPTGSGKSTLVQHFNGLLRPTNGRVYLDDVDIHAREVDRRRVRQQIGLLFQYPEQQLFGETVFADVAFGPRNLGLDDHTVQARVVEALKFVGLPPERFGPRSPFALSNGEMRRVAIAGVLAMAPRMLILDEPTAGLDPLGRRELLAHIDRLHRERGLTTALITHGMDDVAWMCRRVIVLDRGHVVADDAVRPIFADAARLEALGLGVPQVTRAARRLRDRGLPVRPDILSIEEACAAILKALERARGSA